MEIGRKRPKAPRALSSQYSTQFKRWAIFRIWSSAKPRPLINIILQSLELGLVNINVSAKFYFKKSKRFKSYEHFSQTVRWQNLLKLSGDGHCRIWTSAKPRPMKNGIWQSLGLHLVNINCVQNSITIFHLIQEIFTFSVFGARQSLDQR